MMTWESTLLRSIHGKSTNAVKDSTVLPIKKHTRGGTTSFLHHLVSFGCNCNQESDNWACASDCSQSKGHKRSIYLTDISSRLSEK